MCEVFILALTPRGARATVYPGAVLVRQVLLAAVVAAVMLAGCGGDDDKGPQTKAGFISAADSVCSDFSTELAETDSDNPQTPQEIEKANNVLADLYKQLTEGIVDVPLPPVGAARDGAQAFVNSVRVAYPLVEKLRPTSAEFVAAAQEQDRQRLTAAGSELRSELDAFRAARAKSDRLAVEYGLQLCGSLG